MSQDKYNQSWQEGASLDTGTSTETDDVPSWPPYSEPSPLLCTLSKKPSSTLFTETMVDPEKDLNDPVDHVVQDGAKCQRPGCGHIFTPSEEEQRKDCHYHPGQPIFHEGSKGWTCCARRVLEFDQFLKIIGCHQTLLHRYQPIPGSEKKESNRPRHEWYQTQAHVFVDIFCKGSDPGRSSVRFHPMQLDIHLCTKEGQVYTFVLPLSMEILPGESSLTYLTTKVEL